MTTKQAAGIIRMLLGYLKGEIEPPKQETIEEARAFEQQGYECLEMAIKALEQKEKTVWIPVGERLPEETGWYLVTFRVYGGGCAVCELSYRKPENYWTDKDIFKKALSNDEILAWMPLPERYKDGE